jgi:hypothetical protein
MGNVTQRLYDRAGHLFSLTDPDGNTTRYVYDKDWRLIKTVDPTGAVKSVGYDAVGNARKTKGSEKNKGVRFRFTGSSQSSRGKNRRPRFNACPYRKCCRANARPCFSCDKGLSGPGQCG